MQSRRCRCLFPAIVFPGECVKCELTHLHAEKIRITATQIPFRYYSAGKLSWQQYEDLREQIDELVLDTFTGLRHSVLGEKSTLCYFQETIFGEVEELMLRKHNLALDAQDEQLFKVIDVTELLPQFKRD